MDTDRITLLAKIKADNLDDLVDGAERAGKEFFGDIPHYVAFVEVEVLRYDDKSGFKYAAEFTICGGHPHEPLTTIPA